MANNRKHSLGGSKIRPIDSILRLKLELNNPKDTLVLVYQSRKISIYVQIVSIAVPKRIFPSNSAKKKTRIDILFNHRIIYFPHQTTNLNRLAIARNK